MSLKPYRQKIDEIDQAILNLLEKRALLTMEIGRLKYQLNQEDLMIKPQREVQIVSQLQALASVFPVRSVYPVWREIISACRGLERVLRVGYYSHFLKPEMIYGHQVESLKCSNFSQMMDWMVDHRLDLCLIRLQELDIEEVEYLLQDRWAILSVHQQLDDWILSLVYADQVSDSEGVYLYLLSIPSEENWVCFLQERGFCCLFSQDYGQERLCILQKVKDCAGIPEMDQGRFLGMAPLSVWGTHEETVSGGCD